MEDATSAAKILMPVLLIAVHKLLSPEIAKAIAEDDAESESRLSLHKRRRRPVTMGQNGQQSHSRQVIRKIRS
jgi:hypothetical protein